MAGPCQDASFQHLMRLSGGPQRGLSAASFVIAISASVRLAFSSPKPPDARHTTRSLSGLRLGGVRARFRRAGCSQRNVQQYRRTAYSSTSACKSHWALAGVLNPHTHSAQQIDPSKRFRQEITRCLVWSFALRRSLRRIEINLRRRRIPRSRRPSRSARAGIPAGE